LNKKNFIKQIQEVCIDESVVHDIKFLSFNEPDSFSDLVALLKNSDSKTKETIEKLMYFTAKNSVAALLHLIDMQFTLEENTDEFSKTELLDMFLKQSDGAVK
tara:strand:- start:31111 stop:31419 length:309 start_codon:yes stop_codon:yes gene_type:complete